MATTNIIQITAFDGGERNIAGTENTSVQEQVTYFIEKYEPDYLRKALGYPLWNLLKDDGYPAPSSQRFIDLIDGDVEFTGNDGLTQLWQGLNGSDSPLANYIWYWYQRENVSFNTSMGEQKGSSENSSNTTVMMKQSRAWNEMMNVTCVLWDYLQNAKNDDGTAKYPEFDTNQIDIRTLKKGTNIFNL